MHRFVIPASLAISLAVIGLAPVPAAAADFAAFRAACTNGGAFLLGEVPEGKNAQPVIDSICPCLEAGFASYSQPEIDALEADLRTGTSDEARAKYPAYQELQANATGVLNTCFTSQAVNSDAQAKGLRYTPFTLPSLHLALRRVRSQIARDENRRRYFSLVYLLITAVGCEVFLTPLILRPDERAASV